MMDAVSDHRSTRKAASWGETAAGTAPVLDLSLATTMEGTGSQIFPTTLLIYSFFIFMYLLPVVGILQAMERDFLDWSFPYLGLAALDGLLLAPIFFTPLFESTLGTLLLRAAVVALLLYFIYGFVVRTHRAKPATPKIEHDWTQFAFSIHTLIPIMVMGVFDEIAVGYKTSYILLCGGILVIGAVVYMYARNRWLGTAGLLGSALLKWLMASWSANLYWLAHPGLYG
jgi:hypothetical protein